MVLALVRIMRMVTMQSLQCNMCKGDIASSIQNEDFETFVGDQKCMGRICVPADIPVSQILEETFCKLCSGWDGNPKLLSERENNPEPLSEKEDRRYHRNSGLLSEREKITETLGCSFTDFSISGPQSAAGCFDVWDNQTIFCGKLFWWRRWQRLTSVFCKQK